MLPPPSHKHQCRAKFYIAAAAIRGQSRDEAPKFDTDEIMCRIAALEPPEQRGFLYRTPPPEGVIGGLKFFQASFCFKWGLYGYSRI